MWVTLDSAHRHGVAVEDMEHALTQSMRSGAITDRDGRVIVMHIGPARDGSLLEIGVVPGHDFTGDLIAHAMPARPRILQHFGL